MAAVHSAEFLSASQKEESRPVSCPVATRHFSLEVKRSESADNFCLPSSAKGKERMEPYTNSPTYRPWRSATLIKQTPPLILQGDPINHDTSEVTI
jgi:hypothetical protein